MTAADNASLETATLKVFSDLWFAMNSHTYWQCTCAKGVDSELVADSATFNHIAWHKGQRTLREFYAHAHTIVGSEKSLGHALNIIRKTLAEAKRIRVKIEYEVVRHVATMI